MGEIPVKTYASPLDPTQSGGLIFGQGVSNYATNYQLFGLNMLNICYHARKARFPQSLIDGTSNTIMFGEKKGLTYGGTAKFGWSLWDSCSIAVIPVPGMTMASLAAGNPGWDTNSVTVFAYGPGVTPYPANPEPYMLPPEQDQGGNKGEWQRLTAMAPGGCQVAMADGSVRNIRTSITPSVWWAFVTPDGGEVASDP